MTTEKPAYLTSGLILDLFSGPRGWSQGLRQLGLTDIGIEWDDAACRTAMAAGHTATIRADVAAYPTEPFIGKTWGLIASPPCQDFSRAGLQHGIGGNRGRLVHEVLRWTRDLMPTWVACEQVPPPSSRSGVGSPTRCASGATGRGWAPSTRPTMASRRRGSGRSCSPDSTDQLSHLHRHTGRHRGTACSARSSPG